MLLFLGLHISNGVFFYMLYFSIFSINCKNEYALSNQKKNVATDYKQNY